MTKLSHTGMGGDQVFLVVVSLETTFFQVEFSLPMNGSAVGWTSVRLFMLAGTVSKPFVETSSMYGTGRMRLLMPPCLMDHDQKENTWSGKTASSPFSRIRWNSADSLRSVPSEWSGSLSWDSIVLGLLFKRRPSFEGKGNEAKTFDSDCGSDLAVDMLD